MGCGKYVSKGGQAKWNYCSSYILPDLYKFGCNIPAALNNKTTAKYWENGLENGKGDKLRNICAEDYHFCMPICQLNHESWTQIDFAA